MLDDDYQYVLDLGLLREEGRQLLPSNPIYGEIIIRTLSSRSQQELEDISSLTAAHLSSRWKIGYETIARRFSAVLATKQ